jgi:hypothetical protein
VVTSCEGPRCRRQAVGCLPLACWRRVMCALCFCFVLDPNNMETDWRKHGELDVSTAAPQVAVVHIPLAWTNRFTQTLTTTPKTCQTTHVGR